MSTIMFSLGALAFCGTSHGQYNNYALANTFCILLRTRHTVHNLKLIINISNTSLRCVKSYLICSHGTADMCKLWQNTESRVGGLFAISLR